MDINLFDLREDAAFLEFVELVTPRAQRVFRERPNHFDQWNDEEFKARFRLSKNVVQYIINEIEDQISSETKRYKLVLYNRYVYIFFFSEAMLLLQVIWYLLHYDSWQRDVSCKL